jgi:HlyD family secretion protein
VLLDLDEPRDKWQALGDNYRVESRIVVWVARDAITVPLGAIFQHTIGAQAPEHGSSGWALYIVDATRRARLVSVTVGERNDVEAQIVSGLEEGKAVIVHPTDSVKEGVRVTD